MSKPDKAYEHKGAIEAIRSLVKENEIALQRLEDEVLTLDDIVWRTPARQIIDTTDIIQRLAAEADQVANGKVVDPPRAVLYRSDESINSFGLLGDQAARQQDKERTQREPIIARPGIRAPEPSPDGSEKVIQRVMDDLAVKGLIDENGRLEIDHEALRQLARVHIDLWTEEQNVTSTEDPLQAGGIMRKNTAKPDVSDPK